MALPVSRLAPIAVGVAYFCLAATTIYFSRFVGGVAMVWVASALLAGCLAIVPPRQWPSYIGACIVASTMATGLFGFGWRVAGPLALINIGEATLAAVICKRITRAYWPGETLEWLAGYYLGIGLAVPIGSGILAIGLVNHLVDGQEQRNFIHWMVGHSAGLVAFLPLVYFVCHRLSIRALLISAERRLAAAATVIAMAGLTFLVFNQPMRPLMLFPLLMAVAAAIWSEIGVALFLPVVLALIGGAMTLGGRGPIPLMHVDVGDRMQFFELYLSVTMLFALPVLSDQERRRRMMANLAEREAQYRLMSEHVSDMIFHLDPDGTIRYASPSVYQLSGYDPADLIGQNVAALIHADHRQSVRDAGALAARTPGQPVSVEHLGVARDGQEYWFETAFRIVPGEHAMVCVARDVSQRKRLEQDLSLAALTDPLTGLANRRAFFDQAERLVSGGLPACIALIDIDHFKQVNDRFGHGVGDRVLVAVAEAARTSLRQTDQIARVGGEEFAILLADSRIEQAEKVCARLCQSIGRAVVHVDTVAITVTVSAGLATLGDDLSAALSHADSALYRAKADGRNRLALAA